MYGLVQLELVGCMFGESTVLLGVPREQLTRCAHKKCETELASVQRQRHARLKKKRQQRPALLYPQEVKGLD